MMFEDRGTLVQHRWQCRFQWVTPEIKFQEKVCSNGTGFGEYKWNINGRVTLLYMCVLVRLRKAKSRWVVKKERWSLCCRAWFREDLWTLARTSIEWHWETEMASPDPWTEERERERKHLLNPGSQRLLERNSVECNFSMPSTWVMWSTVTWQIFFNFYSHLRPWKLSMEYLNAS